MAQLSVVMLTYNRENFLPSSIESVLSQTFGDFEFVLINNGSTDGSKEICEHYAAKDKRIKLINIEENRGAPPGRNQGLLSATTDYITFVDDDDYCEPGMLELLKTSVKNMMLIFHSVEVGIILMVHWYRISYLMRP